MKIWQKSRGTWVFLVVGCLVAGESNVFASTWEPPAGTDCRWCNTSNWWFGIYPGPSDIVLINQTSECPVVVDYGCNAQCDDMVVSQFGYEAEIDVEPGAVLDAGGYAVMCNSGAGKGTMNVRGGSVDIAEYFKIGYYDSSGLGVLNIDDGEVSVGQYVRLGDMGGNGELNMTGGHLDVAGDLDIYNGSIRLYGGVAECDDILFISPNGTFDIAGMGTLVIRRDVTNIIGHSVRSITACNGSGVVNIDLIGGNTVVTTDCACPEGDMTGDCAVDFYDYAYFASEWLVGVE